MQKKRKTKPKKTQHERFVELARQLGADENEAAFKRKLGVIAKRQPAAPTDGDSYGRKRRQKEN